MTIVAIIAAAWLIISPFVLGYGTTALWTALVAGVLAAGLTLVAGLGAARFYGVAIVGAYLVVSGLFFGGAVMWSSLIAGAVLAVVGYMAARAETSPAPTARA